jgi:hypothetical protein
MSEEKALALFIAAVIESDPNSKAHHDQAAAELRRLHEVEKQRDELLEALAAASVALSIGHNALIALDKARAAIAKAEGVVG